MTLNKSLSKLAKLKSLGIGQCFFIRNSMLTAIVIKASSLNSSIAFLFNCSSFLATSFFNFSISFICCHFFPFSHLSYHATSRFFSSLLPPPAACFHLLFSVFTYFFSRKTELNCVIHFHLFYTDLTLMDIYDII